MTRNDVAIIQQERKTFLSQLETNVGQWRPVLPSHVSIERFKQVVTTAAFTSPDLLLANRRSLWQACVKAAKDGLIPDGEEAALAAYKGNVTYIKMYKGLQKLARQSGEIASITARAVHANDEFSFVYGDDEHITHKPCMDEDRGNVVSAYAIITLKSGEKVREVLTQSDLKKIMSRSQWGQKGPWGSWEEEMARIKAFRRAAKWAPCSIGAFEDEDEFEAPARQEVEAEAWFDPPSDGPESEPSLKTLMGEGLDTDDLDPPAFLDKRNSAARTGADGGEPDGLSPPARAPAN